MLNSLEEFFMEKGMEKAIENLVKKMVNSGILTMEQIVKSTGLGMDYIQKIISPQNVAIQGQT